MDLNKITLKELMRIKELQLAVGAYRDNLQPLEQALKKNCRKEMNDLLSDYVVGVQYKAVEESDLKAIPPVEIIKDIRPIEDLHRIVEDCKNTKKALSLLK